MFCACIQNITFNLFHPKRRKKSYASIVLSKQNMCSILCLKSLAEKKDRSHRQMRLPSVQFSVTIWGTTEKPGKRQQFGKIKHKLKKPQPPNNALHFVKPFTVYSKDIFRLSWTLCLKGQISMQFKFKMMAFIFSQYNSMDFYSIFQKV